MTRPMSSYLTSLLIGLVLLNVFMYFQQPKMIFYPLSGLEATPADWGLGYEDVALQTTDGVRLHGWYVPAPGSKQVLLFFHGNAGNISHRRASLEIFHRLGLNVLIIDYRGYGKSEGSPGEAGLYMDAMAAWDYLINERGFAADEVVIFGRSLGGAVAVQLAAQVPARGLIVESTLSSARDFAQVAFPILSRLIVMRYDFNSVAKLPRVQAPVLVLHSPDDEVMPFHLGERVFEAAPEPKAFVRLRGDHNSGFYLSQPEYEQVLAEWLKGLR
ncbi:MAG: alpha/beta hydrolase [Gammaproteobacteria bacterium]|nr:alpha/beta hydrolase [Gammaproteobacteria bacterium]